MNKLCGIYAIKNMNTGRLYIGSSKNIVMRIETHFRDLKTGRHCNKSMQADYNKGDKFRFAIIKKIPINSRSELLSEEARTIQKYKNNGNDLYNVGVLSVNQFISEESLKKKILDHYCKEHFNCSFESLTCNVSPAKIEMFYYLIDAKTEEEKEQIKEKYQDLIKYQNKERFQRFKRII